MLKEFMSVVLALGLVLGGGSTAKNEEKDLTDKVEKQEITAPIESGDILGTVTILLNGETLDEKPIVSGESIQKKNLLWIYRQLWKSYAL